MHSDSRPEHFVTLFDSNFLPMGMALHASLMSHGQPFHLWVVCMDELVEEQLTRISLPHMTLLPLREVETGALLEVKPGRSGREYCWTLTPFTFQAVFDRDERAARVTYLDADLFFFDDPHILLRELDAADRHVLVTEHAYAPEHSRFLPLSGRFCVQFLTFRRTAEAARVMRWWQEKCLEWCFDRHEGDRFGDQKYLDAWPDLFAHEVHIVRQMEKTLAPWNVAHVEKSRHERLAPVFYHFQGLRFVTPDTVRLCNFNYTIGTEGLRLYDRYLEALRNSRATLKRFGIALPCTNEGVSLKRRVLTMILRDPRIRKIT
ncbi:MAG TPA: hypothetical protein VIH45_00215 [Desulfuromonadaceae bacterium]